MTVSRRTRERVFERDQWRCVACGSPYELTLQHRAGKGMGGSRKAERMSNYLTMCLRENCLLESDAAFAAEGRGKGWKCSRLTVEVPADVPVFYTWEKSWFYLDDTGSRLRLLDRDAA